MGGFVRFDERQDVLLSLEHCAMSLCHTSQSKGAWKWVVLSLHSAFQGAMVCHLSGTMQIGALGKGRKGRKGSVERWLEWYERDRRGEIERIPDGIDELGFPKTRIKDKKNYPPKSYLAPPLELLNRLCCMDERVEEAGGVIPISDQQKRSFKEFNDEYRNQFAHFSPRGWGIEIDLIKERMKDVLDIFDLIIEDPYPFRHLECDEKSAMRSKLADIRSFL